MLYQLKIGDIFSNYSPKVVLYISARIIQRIIHFYPFPQNTLVAQEI